MVRKIKNNFLVIDQSVAVTGGRLPLYNDDDDYNSINGAILVIIISYNSTNIIICE